jgi:arylsulfatase A-like enzyme
MIPDVPATWRNTRTLIGAALTALLLVAGCTASPSHRGARELVPGSRHRPNIVFVLTDDLSRDLVQYMPHVLGMQRLGMTLSNYYVVDSLCCPSRSSIFTGQYPHDTGVFRNSGADGGYRAYNKHGDQPKSFAVALQKAGYRTAMMGKYLNGYLPSEAPAPGWSEWDVSGYAYPEFKYHLNQNGHESYYGSSPADYLTDVLAHKASSFIHSSAVDGKPFALEVATFAPHQPATPAPVDKGTFTGLRAPRGPSFNRLPTNPPTYLLGRKLSARAIRGIDALYEKRVESVQAVDRMIGHLVEVLRVNRQLSNTYFVFSSDNGFHMGQYALLPGKQTAFDTDIRVPLVVTGPGIAAGSQTAAMTSSIDLAPTFEQIAGATPTDAPDGTSLLSLWHGAPPPASWQRAVLVEHHHGPNLPSDPDRQPMRAGNPPSYEAMRTADELYVEYAGGGREFYDTARDPLELHNLAPTLAPAQLATLHAELSGLAHCHGATACGAAASLSATRGTANSSGRKEPPRGHH